MVSKILVIKIFLLLVVFALVMIAWRILSYRNVLPDWKPVCTNCIRKFTKADIPKHIHQVFFFITDKELPKKYVDAQDTWRNSNPEYGYTLWNSSMIVDLIHRRYPDLENLYNSYDHWVKRADMARYLILHEFGGIYADIDIKCRRSMSNLIDTLPLNKSIVVRLTDPWGPSNDFIFAAPKHPFFDHVLKGLPAANRWYVFPYATTIFSTGPMFLWGRLQNYPFQEEIYTISNVTDYLDLMHGSSWHSWDGVIIWWIFHSNVIKYLVIIVVVLVIYYIVKRTQRANVNGR